MDNKYYQIGDLAGILNISRQMIRYYEECGVIKPVRIPDNNYRLYTAMDYFALGEAISLSKLGVNIKDIEPLRMSDYSAQVIHHLKQFIAESEQDVRYRQLLIKRAEQIIEKTQKALQPTANNTNRNSGLRFLRKTSETTGKLQHMRSVFLCIFSGNCRCI